jgi:hypothetical protein
MVNPPYYDVPCGMLTARYFTNNDGTGAAVSGVSVYVRFNGSAVTSASGNSGSFNFPLLSNAGTGQTYSIDSVKSGSSRTDSGINVPTATPPYYDVPCGMLTVTYYANDKKEWAMTGVSVYVKFNGSAVTSASGNSGTFDFPLLSNAGTGKQYSVVSVQSASSRTDSGIDVGSVKILDVPVARFRVAVVKGDFLAQTGVSLYVKTAGGGAVTSTSGNSGYFDFSLFQSSANGAQLNGTPITGGTGAGAYQFVAVKGAKTAQTTTNVDEGPPDGLPGLSGVILMIP